MIFDLFTKKSQKSIDKSINKSINEYSEALEEDINLMVRMLYMRKTYTTDVETLNNRELVFRCPIDEYNPVTFRIGSNMKIDFVSYTGLYSTVITIVEKIVKEEITYYKGEISQPIQKKQRRDNYRLPLITDITYTLLPREVSQYKANTLDISVGGILMETDENIFQTKRVRVNIDIDGKMYNIESEIVKKRENFSNGKNFYHLKFEGLNTKQKNEISRFIFDHRKTQSKRGLSKN